MNRSERLSVSDTKLPSISTRYSVSRRTMPSGSFSLAIFPVAAASPAFGRQRIKPVFFWPT